MQRESGRLLPQRRERTHGTASPGSRAGEGAASHQTASSQLSPRTPTSSLYFIPKRCQANVSQGFALAKSEKSSWELLISWEREI